MPRSYGFPDGQDDIRAIADSAGWKLSDRGIIDRFTRNGVTVVVKYRRAYPGHLCVHRAWLNEVEQPRADVHIRVTELLTGKEVRVAARDR